jgi:hypothetical protein
MLKRLFVSKEEDICPNCGTVCLTTDVFCPNCQKNLDELFEQLPKEEFETKPFINISQDHKLILNWTLATVVGFVLGEVYLSSLTFSLVPLSLIKSKFDWFGIMLGVAAGVATGFSVGFFQCLILRSYFRYSWLWSLATFAGVTGGYFIESFIIVIARNLTIARFITGYWVIIPLIALFIAGIEIGSIQLVFLKNFLPTPWRWVITVGFSWVLAITIGNEVIRPIFYPCCFDYFINTLAEVVISSVVGVIFGIITGIILSQLLRESGLMVQTAT